MALISFQPQTPIEHRILDARDGGLSGDMLMREIAAASLYIPSTAEVHMDGSGLQPVMLEHGGAHYVAVYTALTRVTAETAPYTLQSSGKQFFLRLPPGYGVVVNPGYDAQLLVPPEGAAMLRQDLAKAP